MRITPIIVPISRGISGNTNILQISEYMQFIVAVLILDTCLFMIALLLDFHFGNKITYIFFNLFGSIFLLSLFIFACAIVYQFPAINKLFI